MELLWPYYCCRTVASQSAVLCYATKGRVGSGLKSNLSHKVVCQLHKY